MDARRREARRLTDAPGGGLEAGSGRRRVTGRVEFAVKPAAGGAVRRTGGRGRRDRPLGLGRDGLGVVGRAPPAHVFVAAADGGPVPAGPRFGDSWAAGVAWSARRTRAFA